MLVFQFYSLEKPMKKTLSAFIFTLLTGTMLLSQVSGYKGDKSKIDDFRRVLKWTAPVTSQFTETEKRDFLHFEGAQYDAEKNFIPFYHEKVQLQNGINEVTVQLLDEIYAPADKKELALLQPMSMFISSSPGIQSSVVINRKVPFAAVSIIPFRINPGTGLIEKLVSFTLQVQGYASARAASLVQPQFATSSVLASGTWFRIGVTNTGVHKIDYNFLSGLGIDMSTLDPREIRIYGNGRGQIPFENSVTHKDDLHEQNIFVQGESDGVFDQSDYVLFYGVSPHTWEYNTTLQKFVHHVNDYSDTTYYFLNTDLGAGKRIAMQASSSQTPTHFVNTFDDYQFHELDNENLIKSGREWYGEKFDIINNYSFSFSFPNIDFSSKVWVKTELVSRYSSSHSYQVSTQNVNRTLTVQGAQTGCYYCTYALTGTDTVSFNPSGPVVSVSITRQQNTSPAPIGWLNYIEVNARRQLKMSGGQVLFRDINSAGPGNVAEYTMNGYSSTLTVWDVTDIDNAVMQQYSISGNDIKWTLPSDSLREFVAFDGSFFLTPSKFGKVANQNLHALQPVDYIIISHPSFLAQANELAALHADRDGLTSVVVTPQQIYNEFSAGAQDVTAIRDFIRMLYERATNYDEMPKYLLLFGDGSYDNKRRLSNNTNFIPTFQNLNAVGPTESYVADEFYCLLDVTEGRWDNGSDAGAIDIGVGRFPVRSVDEAQAMVNKVRSYMTMPQPNVSASACQTAQCNKGGEWKTWITFIGDDEDSGIHMSQADQLATMVDTSNNIYNIDKIYLDAYQQEQTPGGERYPSVNEAINKRIAKGSLIMNYTGHGGEVGLAHERILEISQINAWDNICNLPLFVTATCEFSRFDDPARTSAGEYVLLNPNGGAIGLFTTVRLVYSSPNFVLNRNFYNCVFENINGEPPRVGDVYRITKFLSGNNTNNRNFTLLGDPAVRLNYPTNTVVTTHVNNTPVNMSQPDTIRALSRVTIKGYVADTLGNKINGFNGVIYPTVFDKSSTITTLQNDPPISPFVFKLQKNIVYHGKVSVVNGDFEFTFVVPKDISYQYGFGRISYYAENGQADAAGYYENMIIGGADTNAPADVTGPVIRLFMNDSNFVSGGMTDASPRLFAMVRDSNGVNTVGNGIGHDVVAILDDQTDNAIVLNDYYQSDLNSYQSGTILYPFENLSEGSHTLSLKVWDVYNNSTTVKTEFVVSASAQLALKHVLNYPNPFTTSTAFYFEHNQPCAEFNVMIQIFTVSGKLVKTINDQVHTDGYRSTPIFWDGKDDYGDNIGRGTYVYKVFVRSPDGQTAEQYEKLVILN
ncbi:MAG: type IX secretion system sortase PorU [Bacteroidia bacterium]